MPKANDWIVFVFVNIGFIAQVLLLYYFASIADIKLNWSKYRCNPMFMPFSDNIEQDFVYCIQNAQTSFMGYLLQPLQYVTSSLGSLGGSLSEAINDASGMIGNIRSFGTNIFQNIFGVFLNLVIEFQKIIIGITDMIGKLVGILVTMVYILESSIMTMNSSWNGPPGQMVRALGHCFHPKTKIKLQNGYSVFMKDLKLGDVLENGSRVDSIMQIDNRNYREKLYKIPNGVDGEFIYVTGSHYVYCPKARQYIPVKEYSYAIKQEEVKTDYFNCIITHDNQIKIGNHLFWDYEDWKIKTTK